MKMKKIKLQSNDRDIHVECPNCGFWEQLGVDEKRSKLSSLPIVEWLPNGEHEESVHKCVDCETKFVVEWDYDNPINGLQNIECQKCNSKNMRLYDNEALDHPSQKHCEEYGYGNSIDYEVYASVICDDCNHKGQLRGKIEWENW